jgi:hypothetical protein
LSGDGFPLWLRLVIVAVGGCAATGIAVELTTSDRDAPPLRRI